MASMELSAAAYAALEALEAVNDPIADRIDGWLDAIEADPKQRALRRRLIRPDRVWATTVRDPRGTQDWLILWELDGEVAVVQYIGVDVLG